VKTGQKWTGRKTRKEDVLNATAGKNYISPKGREYTFDYRKEGRRYIMIFIYDGFKMQMSEGDFNTTNPDELIDIIIRDSKI